MHRNPDSNTEAAVPTMPIMTLMGLGSVAPNLPLMPFFRDANAFQKATQNRTRNSQPGTSKP